MIDPRRRPILPPSFFAGFADIGVQAREASRVLMPLGVAMACAVIAAWRSGLITDVVVPLLYAAALFVIGAIIRQYATKVDRAVAVVTSINIEDALRNSRGVWITLTLAIAVLVAAEVPLELIPALRREVRHARVVRLTADATKVRDALERYARDHHAYPRATSYAALAETLREVPRSAEWRYEVTCDEGRDCTQYRLTSADGLVEVTNGTIR